MTELQLIEIDGTGRPVGRIVETDDGAVSTDELTDPIFRSVMRRTGLDEARAFAYLVDAGWSNGPLALRRRTTS